MIGFIVHTDFINKPDEWSMPIVPMVLCVCVCVCVRVCEQFKNVSISYFNPFTAMRSRENDQ